MTAMLAMRSPGPYSRGGRMRGYKVQTMESPCPNCGGLRVSHWKGNPLRWRCKGCNMQGWIHRGER